MIISGKRIASDAVIVVSLSLWKKNSWCSSDRVFSALCCVNNIFPILMQRSFARLIINASFYFLTTPARFINSGPNSPAGCLGFPDTWNARKSPLREKWDQKRNMNKLLQKIWIGHNGLMISRKNLMNLPKNALKKWYECKIKESNRMLRVFNWIIWFYVSVGFPLHNWTLLYRRKKGYLLFKITLFLFWMEGSQK